MYANKSYKKAITSPKFIDNEALQAITILFWSLLKYLPPLDEYTPWECPFNCNASYSFGRRCCLCCLLLLCLGVHSSNYAFMQQIHTYVCINITTKKWATKTTYMCICCTVPDRNLDLRGARKPVSINTNSRRRIMPKQTHTTSTHCALTVIP